MTEFTIKLKDYDGDIYMYRDVIDFEFMYGKLRIKYGEGDIVTHHINNLEEISIKRNR
jgi:hypothetical protein